MITIFKLGLIQLGFPHLLGIEQQFKRSNKRLKYFYFQPIAHQSRMLKMLKIASKAEILDPRPLKIFALKFELPLLERYDLSAPQDYW